MKKKYEKPLVEIKQIAVEDGFTTSSMLDSYERDRSNSIEW